MEPYRSSLWCGDLIDFIETNSCLIQYVNDANGGGSRGGGDDDDEGCNRQSVATAAESFPKWKPSNQEEKKNDKNINYLMVKRIEFQLFGQFY